MATKAHGVLAVDIGSAKEELWAAPLVDGTGECAILEAIDANGAELGNTWGAGASWCVAHGQSSTIKTFGEHGRPGNHNLLVLPGIAPGAASVRVVFGDGSSTTAPVVEGYFIVPVSGSPGSPSAEVTSITSLDSAGHQIAQR
jgi:hypothetical protein